MSLLQEMETYGLADCAFNRRLKTFYMVYNLENQLISAHDSAGEAIKQALIYQHNTGCPAFVESEAI
jgi:hypothetical protein